MDLLDFCWLSVVWCNGCCVYAMACKLCGWLPRRGAGMAYSSIERLLRDTDLNEVCLEGLLIGFVLFLDESGLFGVPGTNGRGFGSCPLRYDLYLRL